MGGNWGGSYLGIHSQLVQRWREDEGKKEEASEGEIEILH